MGPTLDSSLCPVSALQECVAGVRLSLSGWALGPLSRTLGGCSGESHPDNLLGGEETYRGCGGRGQPRGWSAHPPISRWPLVSAPPLSPILDEVSYVIDSRKRKKIQKKKSFFFFETFFFQPGALTNQTTGGLAPPRPPLLTLVATQGAEKYYIKLIYFAAGISCGVLCISYFINHSSNFMLQKIIEPFAAEFQSCVQFSIEFNDFNWLNHYLTLHIGLK